MRYKRIIRHQLSPELNILLNGVGSFLREANIRFVIQRIPPL
jgi:hypothetical protein